MPRSAWARGLLWERASASTPPHPAPGAGVGDDRIARDGLRHQDRAGPLDGLQQPLHAAMLVAEHDLKREHLLAVGLEAEVSRLDDAGVYRPDRDLVQLVAGQDVERESLAVERAHRPGGGGLVRRVAPGRAGGRE